MSNRYLTLSDLRKKLGNRARSAIYADLKTGRLPPPIRLGGRLLWNEAEIDELMAALRRGA